MKLPIALSNKHIHLSQADVDVLFGQGYELTHKKDLSQPGQYACEEMVEVVGPKGSTKMRVLGPVRPESQVEVSLADARGLGLVVPVRQSGDVEGTPGCKLVGPKGEVELERGVIVASRHIHMSLEDAEKFGVKDKDIVSVQTEGERGLLFNNVLVRANAAFKLEMHVDLEEGNAAGVKNGELVTLVK
ncbi:phosphate propanoyltransferase [Terrisporobacter sp.]|uniref:phosphate propanoyltransferase n=1 Tax=Terrisporobacter sp. TaxID=1965305 RepID=UPI00260D1E7A|nr:phosphate propanoyltransferase [Terrisporobacter sp.]